MSILRAITGYRIRYTYWSHSKFSHYLQKLSGMAPSPKAATMEEWAEIKRLKIAKSPLMFFVTDVLLDELQNIAFFPIDVFRNISYLLSNRITNRTSIIDTKLPKYEYHSTDMRVLHGLCELVVDLVELEKSGSGSPYRSRERGLEHLDWEISLGDESPIQSKNAEGIKEIYLWWTDTRPTRPDAYEVSGWNEHCGEDGLAPIATRDNDKTRAILKKLSDIEEKHNKEDVAMLIRIIELMNFYN